MRVLSASVAVALIVTQSAAQQTGTSVATVPGVGTIRYAGTALGFQVALDIIEPAGAAFDAGGVCDVKFSLGKYGTLCYKPSAGFWFGTDHDSYGRVVNGVWTIVDRKWLYTEVHLNLTDMAYYFPVPDHIIVKPYGGFGVALTVDRWAYEDDLGVDVDDTDVNAGFNALAGTDFRLSHAVSAFIETRAKLSRHWNVAKFGAGMKFNIGR